MGRLTEYFGRLNQRSTRRNRATPNDIDEKFVLDAQTAVLCDRFRNMQVDPVKVAERDARERMVAKPGPLEAGWTPDGLTRRQIAAARATQALMAMRQEGETPALAAKFDRVYDSIEGEGWGAKVRDLCFGPEPEPVNDAELRDSTVCRRIDGMMVISSP